MEIARNLAFHLSRQPGATLTPLESLKATPFEVTQKVQAFQLCFPVLVRFVGIVCPVALQCRGIAATVGEPVTSGDNCAPLHALLVQAGEAPNCLVGATLP